MGWMVVPEDESLNVSDITKQEREIESVERHLQLERQVQDREGNLHIFCYKVHIPHGADDLNKIVC